MELQLLEERTQLAQSLNNTAEGLALENTQSADKMKKAHIKTEARKNLSQDKEHAQKRATPSIKRIRIDESREKKATLHSKTVSNRLPTQSLPLFTLIENMPDTPATVIEENNTRDTTSKNKVVIELK